MYSLKLVSRRELLLGCFAGSAGVCLGWKLPMLKVLLQASVADERTQGDDSGMYGWRRLAPTNGLPPADGVGLVSFKGGLLVLGGWNPSNEPATDSKVWASRDGSDWTLQTVAPWEPRHTAAYVVFRDKVWIIGGDANLGHYQSDVWSSSDGLGWEMVLDEAPWKDEGRVLHHVCLHENSLFLIGGQTISRFAPTRRTTYYTDVWTWDDGVSWRKIADRCPWGVRSGIGGSVSLGGYIYLIGGGAYDQPEYPHRVYKNDVWRSKDGIGWELVAATAPFAPRFYHSTCVFDGKMWVVGGQGATGRNLRDTWCSKDGVTWEAVYSPWEARHACSTVVHKDELYLVGGPLDRSDVWVLGKARA